MMWVGVDVGGRRKGFDVAVIDGTELVELRGRLTCAEVVGIVDDAGPYVVAIDSPRSCAPDGDRSRECERRLAKEICGIRWTPDAASVQSNGYYGWIVQGLILYDALGHLATELVEVFPNASWTCWIGQRGTARRSAWTRNGLADLAVAGVPKRTNQDQRDAIAAAVTARQYTEGSTQPIGEIVVPIARI
jgi:predicted nuclease with RNAse H fold